MTKNTKDSPKFTTAPASKPRRVRDRSREAPLTIWLPVELIEKLDEEVKAQQERASKVTPAARVTRHAVARLAIKSQLNH
jgi:hypothetical protein